MEQRPICVTLIRFLMSNYPMFTSNISLIASTRTLEQRTLNFSLNIFIPMTIMLFGPLQSTTLLEKNAT